MFSRREHSANEGVVLVITLIFLIAMALIVGYTAARAISHSNQLTHDVEYDQAYLALDGAHHTLETLSGGINELYIGLPDNYRFVQTVGGVSSLNLPPADDAEAAAAGITWQPFGNASIGGQTSWVAMALPGNVDGIDNDADGESDELDERGYIYFYMASRVLRDGELMAYIAAEDSHAPGENISVWNNAIFANAGQDGQIINGNVSIAGSVHILGNDPNAAAVVALDLSGTTFVHNNYNGMPADLRARIPLLPTVDWNGDGSADEETLHAKLRIRNGTVELGGNSEIGEAGTSSTAKLTMDGVYLGNGGGEDVLSGQDKIYSDNGYLSSYDLHDFVSFPTYNDDAGEIFVTERYLEDFNLTTWVDSDGTAYTNNAVGANTVYEGDITLTSGAGNKAGANNFYWNASTMTASNQAVVDVPSGSGAMPSKAQIDALKSSTQHFLWYDAQAQTLVVNNRIPVDGNFRLNSGSGSGNQLFDYEGKGSILAFDADNSGNGGTVGVEASLKTTEFPNQNVIGLISQKDFVLGTTAQIEMMGGFYAQGRISTNKQTHIVGALVGNYFDLGGQVPHVWHVPALSSAWTDGMRMIGANAAQNPVEIAWREYNVRLQANE